MTTADTDAPEQNNGPDVIEALDLKVGDLIELTENTPSFHKGRQFDIVVDGKVTTPDGNHHDTGSAKFVVIFRADDNHGADAPEKIWAKSGMYYQYVEDWSEGEWYTGQTGPTFDGGRVEYTRADLAKPRVKPLVWGETSYGAPEAFASNSVYRINRARNGGFCLFFGRNEIPASDTIRNYPTEEAAKAAADAHRAAYVLAQLEGE